jgi:hypothetical protein
MQVSTSDIITQTDASGNAVAAAKVDSFFNPITLLISLHISPWYRSLLRNLLEMAVQEHRDHHHYLNRYFAACVLVAPNHLLHHVEMFPILDPLLLGTPISLYLLYAIAYRLLSY